MILDMVREHYIRTWGTPSRIMPLHLADFSIDVYKWDAVSARPGLAPVDVTIYATVGASTLQQPGYSTDHRLEFYTGMLPEKDEIATVLADVAHFPIKEQAAIGHTHSITWLEPLWPGTRMSSVFLQRSDHDHIPMLVCPDDGVHVEFLDVTPIYPSELAFKKEHSLDALIEHWWRHNVKYWDPNRPPEPA